MRRNTPSMDTRYSSNRTRRDMVAASLRRFQITLVFVIVFVVVGALGFFYLENPSFHSNIPGQSESGFDKDNAPRSILDALYWAIETISTTGYGDIHPQTPLGKLWVIVFTLFGVMTVAYAGAYALAFIVEGHLTLAVREKKMAKELKTLHHHYIICGLGRVGKEIVRQFRAHAQPFVVIDRDTEIMENELSDDELRIIGDTTQDDVLKEARIETARGLITCLNSDADNVFTILTAKGLNANLFIIARGENERSINKLMRAGANRVVLPSHIGGVRMASMAIRPAVVDFLEQTILFSSDREPLLLEEIPVQPNSSLIGKMLKETKIKTETDVLILAVKQIDGHLDYNPSSMYVIQQGDILIGMGHHSHFDKLRKWMGTH